MDGSAPLMANSNVMHTYSMKINRKTIQLVWLATNAASSAITAAVCMLYWNFTYLQEANVDWFPLDDFLGMFVVMPFGWLLYLVLPPGWLSLIGLSLALYNSSLKPLLLSIVSSVVFGAIWPKWFVAMMGV